MLQDRGRLEDSVGLRAREAHLHPKNYLTLPLGTWQGGAMDN